MYTTSKTATKMALN